ncbi:DUF1173 family protein [Pseudonocardia sp. P1]|nr:DUF1173 family protein [Pseudonocardia sp. Ae707_Ps1]
MRPGGSGSGHPDGCGVAGTDGPGGRRREGGRPWQAPRGARVLLAGRSVSLARFRGDAPAHRALAERARVVEGCGWCLCAEPAPRLVIRRRGGVYYLACWPSGGSEHAPGCAFRTEASAGAAGVASRGGVLREDDGGIASVSLSVPLHAPVAGHGGRLESPGSGGGADGAGRARMGLLGLLQVLWERAGLTVAPAGRRGWAECHWLLQAAAESVVVSGRRLVESCYVVPPFDPADPDRYRPAFEHFIDGLGTRDGVSHRGLVLAAVRGWAETRYGHRMDLRHHRVPVFVSAALMARVRHSAPSVFAAARPAGSEQVVLALVQRSDAGNLSMVSAAVMLTNAGFVPADSSHEVVMADALSRAGRAFVKPLRYDGAAEVLPDFVLTDTDPPTAVEVWGMADNEDYVARRDRKRLLYRLRRTPLIEWDPGDRLPDLTRH